ncbi:MAG: carbohydrate-binding domain-containing protein [Anaerolineae bacterium]|nr:carbohydrate-binding domain-containing protein [Anaerolineae bacterium]
MMKRVLAVALLLTMLLSATGCTLAVVSPTGEMVAPAAEATDTATAVMRQEVAAPTAAKSGSQAATAAATEAVRTVAATEVPVAEAPDLSGATRITLGDPIAVEGRGASAGGNVVTITAAGAYEISGSLDDGQILVDTEDKQAVTLILSGLDLTCTTSAPLVVMSAEKVVVHLTEGTENRLTDGEAYVYASPDEDEPNATLFSKDDLTISGHGALIITANYHDAITSKDDLAITGGTIRVDSVADGIRGRDSLSITGGTIQVTAAGDGIESNNDEDPDEGIVSIEGGRLDITAGEDGIEAETRVTVRGGDITLSTGGGSVNSSSQGSGWGNWAPPGRGAAQSDQTPSDEGSAKGIKAGAEVTIEGGSIQIDSSDDAIHSNDSLTITGGTIAIASGDDGIHADAEVTIRGGQITIAQSYEGIESAVITIGDGNIHIVSSDDGLNVAGGNDGSALGGRPGQNSFSLSGNQYLDISGGYIAVDASGDGLDINGHVTMSGGILIVHGPTSNMNGALDYDGRFTMSGGFLVAAGSSGMAQAPDASSSQRAVLVNLPSALSAGTLFHIASDQGEDILTFEPLRSFQSVALSSPELDNGTSYVVFSGGSSTGALADGLYSGGSYSGGTEIARFTISSIVTGVGSPSRFGPGGGRGGGRR